MEKPFTKKGHIDELLKCIKDDKQHGGRVYRDKRRYHKSDGIIFTPNDGYQIRTVRTLFKFKYADEMSIDLKLCSKEKGEIHFTCMGERNIELPYNVQVIAEDYQKLARYASHALKDPKTVVIVELVYDLIVQQWKLKMIRTDKNRANFIKVVTDTVRSVGEHISVDDLRRYFAKR